MKIFSTRLTEFLVEKSMDSTTKQDNEILKELKLIELNNPNYGKQYQIVGWYIDDIFDNFIKVVEFYSPNDYNKQYSVYLSFDPTDDKLNSLISHFERGTKINSITKLRSVTYPYSIYNEQYIYPKNYNFDLISIETFVPEKKKEGCFIATVCYGSYDTEELIILRNYRDNILLKTVIGKIFVKFYYLFSPSFARLLTHSKFLTNILKKYFLTPFVKKLALKSTKKTYCQH